MVTLSDYSLLVELIPKGIFYKIINRYLSYIGWENL